MKCAISTKFGPIYLPGAEFEAIFEEECHSRGIRLFVLPPPAMLSSSLWQERAWFKLARLASLIPGDQSRFQKEQKISRRRKRLIDQPTLSGWRGGKYKSDVHCPLSC